MFAFRPKGLLAFAGGLFCLSALAPLPLRAHQGLTTVSGRVADAADNPLAGAVVLLHAITDQGGTELARDTADATGAFRLEFVLEEGSLYFVATRVGGDIFMAEPFREAPARDIVLRAGAGVEPLRLDELAASPPAGPVPGAEERAHDGWWVALLAALIVGGVVWLVHRGRVRAPRARELMVELARLDETRASVPGAADDGYRVRREELRTRLLEALELDPDADRH